MLAPRHVITAIVVFGSMLLLVIVHSHGVAQLDLPRTVLSALVVSGGGVLGLIASLVWIRLLETTDPG